MPLIVRLAMPLVPASYMDVLAEKYQDIEADCLGDGTDYDHILHVSGPPIPSKAELDVDRDYYTRLRVWNAIKTERDARRANGVKVGEHWLHSDDSSRIQQLALVMFGASLPPIQWKCLAGEFVTMTPQFAQAIFQSSAANDIAIFTAAETHKAMMNASPNPIAYDYSSGWPPTYEGSLLL